MNLLDCCRQLIGLDSTPSHGNLAAAEYVGELCRQAGLHVEFQRETLEGIDQANVIARTESAMPEQEFLLQAHLDTVDAGHFSHWTKTQSNPFNASIYDDILYGLGAADVKLDFLCKLMAAKEFAGRQLKRPVVLAATFGAQSGMAGAIKLIRRKKINATHALIGEPTDMRLVHAGMGLAVVEISIPFSEEEKSFRRDHDLRDSASTQSRMFAGRAAHSARPQLGENAIMKMLQYLSQLPEGIAIMDLDGGINYNSVPAHAVLEIDPVAGFKDPLQPKISRIYRSLQELEHALAEFHEQGFDPPYATMNLGMIRTDESQVTITGSCRLPPSVTDEIYARWMQKLEKAVQDEGATFRVRDYRRGFSTDENSELVKTMQETMKTLDMNPQVIKLSQSSEANVFSRLGVECVVWGPGQSVGNSHAPNECVRISDLRKAIELYKRLIERFCL